MKNNNETKDFIKLILKNALLNEDDSTEFEVSTEESKMLRHGRSYKLTVSGDASRLEENLFVQSIPNSMGNNEEYRAFPMSSKEFLESCKEIVVDYFNSRVEKTDGKQITKDDVYIVWSVKVLQNNKALVSTNVSDGMYYEITYNGDTCETYVDAYKKWENFTVNQRILVN